MSVWVSDMPAFALSLLIGEFAMQGPMACNMLACFHVCVPCLLSDCSSVCQVAHVDAYVAACHSSWAYFHRFDALPFCGLAISSA